MVGPGDVRVADGVDDQPRQVDRFAFQRPARRPGGPAAACPRRDASSARSRTRRGSSRGRRRRAARRACAGRVRCSRGSRPAACAVRGWRRRRTDAPGSRWRAAPTARRRCGRASGSAPNRAGRPRCGRLPGRRARSASADPPRPCPARGRPPRAAAAATLDSGASWRRMIRMPAVVARDQRDRGDHAEHAEHPQQGVVDDSGRQARHDGLPAVPGVQADHPVAAQAVEVDGLRRPVRRAPRRAGPRRRRSTPDRPPSAVITPASTVRRDDRADGPRCLARCVEEAGPGRLRIERSGRKSGGRGPTGGWSRIGRQPARVASAAPANDGGGMSRSPPSACPPRAADRRAGASGSVAARTRSRRRCRCTRPPAAAPG